jgi:hypothetical protein
LSGCIAACCALVIALVIPQGGDAAAHLYRTFLVQRGAFIWDNLWYAGQYPLASYSLLYYLPAALIGNDALAACGVVVSAVLFASLVVRVWGRVARLAAYCFAFLAGGQFLTGDYAYTLGFMALLATLAALERRLYWLAIVFAALTLGCSPLAFLFLCLALAALFMRSSTRHWREVLLGLPVLVIAGVEFAALRLFPTPSLSYPFAVWRLALGIPVGLLGFALSRRSRAGRPLASLFAVWTIATFAAYVVPSPVGHNLLRPEALVFPMMLLAGSLAGFRPRWLAVAALTAAFAANIGPYTTTALARGDPSAQLSFWRPLLAFVAAHRSPDYRLEVVPTVNHWEAYYVPKAGFAIARGWYRQLDTGDNAVLYRTPFTPSLYRAWLRSVGVRYVILTRAEPAVEATAERHLLLSGGSGLRKVFVAASGTIYELLQASPILTGPAHATLTRLTFDRIDGWVTRPGRYLLRVHYTPYWILTAGSLCLRRGGGDMTELDVSRTGRFSLHADEDAITIITSALDLNEAKRVVCPAPRAAARPSAAVNGGG